METDPIRQIAIFRVPDLQACLTQLRLSRTGLKRDLQTRLGTHLRVLIASAELSADPFTRKKKDDAGAPHSMKDGLRRDCLFDMADA